MSPTGQGILSDRVYKDIQKGLSSLDRAIQETEIAEECNVDMSDLKADIEIMRNQYVLIKQKYFPNKK